MRAFSLFACPPLEFVRLTVCLQRRRPPPRLKPPPQLRRMGFILQTRGLESAGPALSNGNNVKIIAASFNVRVHI